MKDWNASKLPPTRPQATRLKAVARRVRDWLNDFLEEPVDYAVGEIAPSGDPSVPPASSSPFNMDEHNAQFASAREKQMGAPVPSEFDHPGPPEDWLRRVREAAPGLLLSSEGGTRSRLEVPQAALGRNELRRGEPSTPATPGRSPEAVSSDLDEARVAPVQASPASPAPKMKMWFGHLKREFLHLSTRAAERKEESQSQERYTASFPAKRERPLARAKESPELVNEARPRHAVERRIHGVATLAPRWTERLRQRIQAALQTASPKRSILKEPADSIDAPGLKSSLAASLPSEELRTAQKIRAGVDRGPSPSAVTPRNFERSPKPAAHVPRPWKRAQGGIGIPAPRTNPRTWTPLAARADDFSNRTSETTETGPERRPTASRTEDLRAVPAEDQWPVASSHSPESEIVDPWPELPESQPRSTSDGAQFLRSAERLRALDVEQQGGR
jgi:hypothetical protein